MSTLQFFLILFSILCGAASVSAQNWGFAAMSLGLALFFMVDAICDAIKGAKP